MEKRKRRLRELREDRDLTQKEIALILHCSQRIYSDYETGKVKLSEDTLCRLALYHQTSIDYLLGLTDDPAPPPRRPDIEALI